MKFQFLPFFDVYLHVKRIAMTHDLIQGILPVKEPCNLIIQEHFGQKVKSSVVDTNLEEPYICNR